VGGPACIYCVAHNTQYTFLALIDSTWTERRKAVRETSWRPGHRFTQHWQRLNSPHEGYTRPDNISSTTTTYSLVFLAACLPRSVFHLLRGSTEIHLAVSPGPGGTFRYL
jgi:hypothetical protein